jgi:hypothetical protein
MSVHNHFTKVIFAFEEIVSNPKEVIFRLLGEGNSWANACMYEEEITTDEVSF